MQTLLRNYDLVATASTAGILLLVHAAWPFWIVWAGVLTYQLGNRLYTRSHG